MIVTPKEGKTKSVIFYLCNSFSDSIIQKNERIIDI